MPRRPRKISLAQCVRQGDTTIDIWCVTPDPKNPGYGGGPKVCGHRGEMPIADAITRWGKATSLSDLPLVCSVCGGREIDVRAHGATQNGRTF